MKDKVDIFLFVGVMEGRIQECLDGICGIFWASVGDDHFEFLVVCAFDFWSFTDFSMFHEELYSILFKILH